MQSANRLRRTGSVQSDPSQTQGGCPPHPKVRQAKAKRRRPCRPRATQGNKRYLLQVLVDSDVRHASAHRRDRAEHARGTSRHFRPAVRIRSRSPGPICLARWFRTECSWEREPGTGMATCPGWASLRVSILRFPHIPSARTPGPRPRGALANTGCAEPPESTGLVFRCPLDFCKFHTDRGWRGLAALASIGWGAGPRPDRGRSRAGAWRRPCGGWPGPGRRWRGRELLEGAEGRGPTARLGEEAEKAAGRGGAPTASRPQPWPTRPPGRATSRRSSGTPTALPSPRPSPRPPLPPSQGVVAAPRN